VAGGCSGASKPDNQTFWVNTANNEPFAVYCGVVPSPWFFNGASSTYGTKGTVVAAYKTASGGQIVLEEGAFCTSSGTDCPPHGASSGTAKFGDLNGTLYPLTAGYKVYINGALYATLPAGLVIISPGTAHGYTAMGTGVSQTTFVNIVAALIKVPKS
jgi:hypothetical protein